MRARDKGEEHIHNVNRLLSIIWDDIYERTDITSTRLPLTPAQTPTRGELILFLTNKPTNAFFPG